MPEKCNNKCDLSVAHNAISTPLPLSFSLSHLSLSLFLSLPYDPDLWLYFKLDFLFVLFISKTEAIPGL